MAKQIKLVKSLIGRKENQIATAHSLGLKKVGQVVVQPDNEQTNGKINKISHRQEARRHRGELHCPPHLLRHRRREGVPPPCSLCGEGRGGPPGQGAPRQAVLPARPRGQGRQGQGIAVIQKRSG